MNKYVSREIWVSFFASVGTEYYICRELQESQWKSLIIFLSKIFHMIVFYECKMMHDVMKRNHVVRTKLFKWFVLRLPVGFQSHFSNSLVICHNFTITSWLPFLVPIHFLVLLFRKAYGLQALSTILNDEYMFWHLVWFLKRYNSLILMLSQRESCWYYTGLLRAS